MMQSSVPFLTRKSESNIKILKDKAKQDKPSSKSSFQQPVTTRRKTTARKKTQIPKSSRGRNQKDAEVLRLLEVSGANGKALKDTSIQQYYKQTEDKKKREERKICHDQTVGIIEERRIGKKQKISEEENNKYVRILPPSRSNISHQTEEESNTRVSEKEISEEMHTHTKEDGVNGLSIQTQGILANILTKPNKQEKAKKIRIEERKARERKVTGNIGKHRIRIDKRNGYKEIDIGEFESGEIGVESSVTEDIIRNIRGNVRDINKENEESKSIGIYNSIPEQIPAGTAPNSMQDGNGVIDTVSLRDKHSELLTAHKELVLPVHYKHLRSMASALDTVINLLKSRSLPLSFTQIRHSIEQAYHRNFNINILGQILTLIPEFYTHKWVILGNSRQLTLIIDIPSNILQILSDITSAGENYPIQHKFLVDGGHLPISSSLMHPMNDKQINTRREILHVRLLNLTNEYHRSYLREKGISHYDPFLSLCWDSSFEVHEVPQVAVASLRARPQVRDPRNIILDEVNQSIKDALDKTHLQRINTTPQILQGESNSTLRASLSARVLEKIRTNEEKRSVRNEYLTSQQLESKRANKRIGLHKLIDQIRTILLYAKKTTIFLSDLIEKLMSVQQDFKSKEEIISSIYELRNICPEFIELKSNVEGALIKVDKTLQLSLVKNKVNDYCTDNK